jgi:hypothetical protein
VLLQEAPIDPVLQEERRSPEPPEAGSPRKALSLAERHDAQIALLRDKAPQSPTFGEGHGVVEQDRGLADGALNQDTPICEVETRHSLSDKSGSGARQQSSNIDAVE